jgi:hypothetical protein
MGLRDIWARSSGGRQAAGADLAAGTPTLSSLNLGRQARDAGSAPPDSAGISASAQIIGNTAAACFAIND